MNSTITTQAAKNYSEGLWSHEPIEAIATVLGTVQLELDKAERRIPKKPVTVYEDDLKTSFFSIWWDIKNQLLGEIERRGGAR